MKNVVQRMIAAILLHIFLWREMYKHAAFLHCEMLRHTARVLMLPMCTIVQKCMKALYIYSRNTFVFIFLLDADIQENYVGEGLVAECTSEEPLSVDCRPGLLRHG